MGSTTAEKTAEKLKELFNRHGLPEQLVSDNGPPFSSKEFTEYCEYRGVEQIFTPPYHPNSNGEAERFGLTFRNALYKGLRAKKSEEVAVSDFLSQYRYKVTPYKAVGKSPEALLMARKLRTILDIVKAGTNKSSSKYRDGMKQGHNGGKCERKYAVRQEVHINNYIGAGDKWIPEIVTRASNYADQPRSCRVAANVPTTACPSTAVSAAVNAFSISAVVDVAVCGTDAGANVADMNAEPTGGDRHSVGANAVTPQVWSYVTSRAGAVLRVCITNFKLVREDWIMEAFRFAAEDGAERPHYLTAAKAVRRDALSAGLGGRSVEGAPMGR
ncbi:hypothetical protein ANCDUO_06734 [Ancylostoma duodenale]|uniref:Integrase catalytic domain-containing protein n=1 Tax=Ancylostoma duodenale TaxID=51022 RepID=A0A0C2H0V2_9BILA|nr:hypothetical protein ANCDUO_06734 [Ancylostoma duodenale]